MGLFDLFGRRGAPAPQSALDEAEGLEGSSQDAVTALITRILRVGIDGIGPYSSAEDVARAALEAEKGDRAAAVERIVSQHTIGGAAGGFLTGLGGFVTLAVALPANLVEFYVQATRMVAAVAWLRGYDLADNRVRTAILLTEVGSNAHDILAKAGISTSGSAAVNLLSRNIPRSAVMMIQKAVGFQMLRTAGLRVFSRMGRMVPLIGGAVGGGLDYAMMRRIAQQARNEFPGRV